MTNKLTTDNIDNRGNKLCVHGDALTWNDCHLHPDAECFAAFCETCNEEYPDCELGQSLKVILEHLEDTNAHTIYALLAWDMGRWSARDDETMLRGYKAAQLAIYGTQ